MATTVAYTPLTDAQYLTLTQINALFTNIATVLNAKLDVRGDTVGATLVCVDSSIINVPEPVATGDLERN